MAQFGFTADRRVSKIQQQISYAPRS